MHWWSKDRSVKVFFLKLEMEAAFLRSVESEFQSLIGDVRKEVKYVRLEERSFVSFEESILIIVGLFLV